MEVFDAIRTLLAVRSYRDKPVPDAVVRRILEAGRMSGSASNRQPWHFIVVQERDTLRKVAALARTGPYIAQAPLVIVVAIDKSVRFAVSDASRAIQCMFLAAWADGVGSNWVGFGEMDGAKDLLNIPAELEVLAVLPFGYPVAALGRGRKKRKSLAEIAHRERFGRPFE
jgi:nitroreductase